MRQGKVILKFFNKALRMRKVGRVHPGVFRVVVSSPMDKVLSSSMVDSFVDNVLDFIFVFIIDGDWRRSVIVFSMRVKACRFVV